MKTTILDSGDFAYLAEVTHIPEPVGGLCLTITSRWQTAKNPEDEQIRLRICLDEAGLRSLIDVLQQEVSQCPR